jgi:hypothetical protein
MENENVSFRKKIGECCRIGTYKFQNTCAHDGCNAKVHRECQWIWLTRARLPIDVLSPIYCPAHNIQRGDFIREYYNSQQVQIPPSIAAQLHTNPSNLDTSDINPREEPPVQEINCSICLKPIDLTNRRTTMRTHCNHIYHCDCIEEWMKQKVRL